jgi:hypothetical protein
MAKPSSNEPEQAVPTGVVSATLLLLRRAIQERARMLKLGIKHPQLSLWLMPDGRLVYRKRRLPKKGKPKALLIHQFTGGPTPSKIDLVSRVMVWVADANCTALASMMTRAQLAESYRTGFFFTIRDEATHEKARIALAAETKERLLRKHTKPSPKSCA